MSNFDNSPESAAVSLDSIALLANVRAAIETGDQGEALAIFEPLPPSEAIHIFSHLPESEQSEILKLLGKEMAAWLVDQLPDKAAAAAINSLETGHAVQIVEELDSDDKADVLAEMQEGGAEAILQEMDPETAEDLRSLMEYSRDLAGGLMMTETFKSHQSVTVGALLRRLSSEDEDFAHYRSQHPYVVGDNGELAGVVSLRNLLSASRRLPLSEIMIPARSVNPSTSIRELRDLFNEFTFFSLPVVDENNKLIGVVTRNAVAEAELERAETDVQKVQGVVVEELRSMPVWTRSRRRLSWLSVNIVLNIIAASVITLYESTLAAVIALAVFLPIVSDMSGCSGNQAVAVSLRELSLGLARPGDLLRVWMKEISVGLINGLALGVLIALTAWGWKGNPFIGLVVGTALALNTVVAVSIGGTVPLLLSRLKIDPAVAAGPLLTTITDMCGFFLVLSLATLMMPMLV